MAIPSVLIIGGGYAGVHTARRLGDTTQVTLVSDANFLLFTPMLAEVAAGYLDPRHIIIPLRQLCPHARVVQGSVESIDLATRSVLVRPLIGAEPSTLTADVLVIALGAVSAGFGIPGVDRWAMPFKTILDALRVRNRILALLERADQSHDPHLTKLAVVGAGYSGVELAAALAEFLGPAAAQFFRNAPAPEVSLVDMVARITPALSPALSRSAEEALAVRKVSLVLGTPVAEVNARGLMLEDGRQVEAATVVWAAGIGPNPLLITLGLPTERGRLVVDDRLRVSDQVFALGDAAHVPDGRGGVSPPTAQFAIRQGKYLGKNLMAVVGGRPTPVFRYRTLGELVSLGHRNAVGRVLGVPVWGWPAWFLWRTYYLMRLPTAHRKTRVALAWALDLMFPPDIAWLPSSDLGPAP